MRHGLLPALALFLQRDPGQLPFARIFPYSITLSLGWLFWYVVFAERTREHAKERRGARVFSKFLPSP